VGITIGWAGAHPRDGRRTRSYHWPSVIIFEGSFESYGAPRIKAELSKKGYRVSRPRVARIMRVNNLFARRKRKFKITTDSKHNYPIAPNILNQDFTVSRANQV